MNFNLEQNFVLENEYVSLRPLTINDYEHLLPFALNEPETWEYSLISAAGKDGLKSYLDNALKARQDGREYPFIIFDKKTNEYAGSTRFYDIQPYHKTLLLGYTWLGEKFRGTGLNKQCKFLLLEYAFEKLGAARVEFRANANNEVSIAAMKSIGCRVEGILRSHLNHPSGERRNSIILSILKNEWIDDVKEKLSLKLI